MFLREGSGFLLLPWGGDFQGFSEPSSGTIKWALDSKEKGHRFHFLVCFNSVSSAIFIVAGLSPRIEVRPPGQPGTKGLRKKNDDDVQSTYFGVRESSV